MASDVAASLTEEEIAEVARRVEQRQLDGKLARVMPPSPVLAGHEKELADMYQARQRFLRAEAAAEQERQRRVREAVEERKRREWEANAPKRAAAEAELAKLAPELAAAERRHDDLLEREAELRRVASR
jgi:hypothetical protein